MAKGDDSDQSRGHRSQRSWPHSASDQDSVCQQVFVRSPRISRKQDDKCRQASPRDFLREAVFILLSAASP